MRKVYIANRGRLIVELIVAEKEGLVEIPDSVKDAQPKRRAKVLAVGGKELGPDGEYVPNFFAAGDVVVLSSFTQPEQIYGPVFCVRFNEVLALETDEEGN